MLAKSVLVNFTTTNVLDVKYSMHTVHIYLNAFKSGKVGHGGERVKPIVFPTQLQFFPNV